MRNLFFVLIVFFCGFATSYAQQGVVVKLDLGASDISGDTNGDTSFKFAMSPGVGYNFQLNDNFALEPALKYFLKGATTDDENLNLSYISLPLTLKVYPSESFIIHAGPEVGFLVGAQFDGEDVKDSFETADFGMNFGLDYFVNEALSLGFNGVLGFSDISSSGVGEAKNQAYMMSLNYYFIQ